MHAPLELTIPSLQSREISSKAYSRCFKLEKAVEEKPLPNRLIRELFVITHVKVDTKAEIPLYTKSWISVAAPSI
jgi:hypothetical protein